MVTKIVLTIVGMAVLNYLFRMLPLVVLSRIKLPQLLQDWLGFVPVAVLGAIVAQGIFVPGDQVVFAVDNPYLMAAVPTLIVAWKSRSLIFTLVAGMAMMAVLQQ